MKNKKNYMGFLTIKIQQILKRFAGTGTLNVFTYFFQISNEKYKIEKNPSDVLNKLGSRGYRVVGFTITADEKLAWTLELKIF